MTDDELKCLNDPVVVADDVLEHLQERYRRLLAENNGKASRIWQVHLAYRMRTRRCNVEGA